jgi:hypothetical protein
MELRESSKSELAYGHKILDSGLKGIRSGGEEFLHGKPLAPFLNQSCRKAARPAVFGACLGMLSSLAADERESMGRLLFFGLLGGAIGFGAGVVSESRPLTASAAHAAWQNIHKVRDEHWVEKHPVAYA